LEPTKYIAPENGALLYTIWRTALGIAVAAGKASATGAASGKAFGIAQAKQWLLYERKMRRLARRLGMLRLWRGILLGLWWGQLNYTGFIKDPSAYPFEQGTEKQNENEN
jgi:hypothetical protein